MPNPPTKPAGCLGALIHFGHVVAAGALLLIFGIVGALSSALSSIMGGIPGIGALMMAVLLNVIVGFLLGGIGGLLTARRLDRHDYAARRGGRRAGNASDLIAFVALLLTGTVCGAVGSLLAGRLFAGTITLGDGMLYGSIVALVGYAVIMSQTHGSG